MLAWLLNPRSRHGLGSGFLKAFVHELVREDVILTDRVLWLLADWEEADVDREWFNLDILISCKRQKLIIAIENKIDSSEHDNQLNRYKENVDTTFQGWHVAYVYLTPQGINPRNGEGWRKLSYGSIVTALSVVQNGSGIDENSKLLINDYLQIVRREIMDDTELEEACWKIYDKHFEALNLIFESVNVGGSTLRAAIERVLQLLEKEGEIILCRDRGRYSKPAFHLKKMDNYLGVRSSPGGTWGNNYLYVYWFDRRDPKRVVLRCEVGPCDANEEALKKINCLLRVASCKEKCAKDVYGRMWMSKPMNAEGKDFSIKRLEEWVRKSVKEAIEVADNWIKKTNTSNDIG